MWSAKTQQPAEHSQAATWSNHKVAGGLSLKPEHFDEAALCDVEGIWFEVHPENYFISGGPRLSGLHKVAERHPISLHGVGASLGSGAPNPDYITQLSKLVDQINPIAVSQHAAWSSFNDVYFADLLPLPRTESALQLLAEGVQCLQEGIGRSILLENPTNYLPVKSDLDEPDFLVEVSKRTGCGLLLDINNIYLSARNVGIDPHKYILSLPSDLVGEIHVAGHKADIKHGENLLIDSHDCEVTKPVWELLSFALQHLGPIPVLLERDDNLPSFANLVNELSLVNSALTALEQPNTLSTNSMT